MNGFQIGIISSEDLAALADLRRQADELQVRYDRIMAKYGGAPRSVAPMSPQAAAPLAPAAPAVLVAPVGPSAPVPPPAPIGPFPPPAKTVSGAQEILSAVASAAPPAPPVPPAGPVTLPPAVAAGSLAGLSLREAVIFSIRRAGRPIPFEKIYKDLQDGGAALPAEKPMLVVRKILFDDATFAVAKGAYTLK